MTQWVLYETSRIPALTSTQRTAFRPTESFCASISMPHAPLWQHKSSNRPKLWKSGCLSVSDGDCRQPLP
eukprot:609406-Amphidinium_carterae.1